MSSWWICLRVVASKEASLEGLVEKAASSTIGDLDSYVDIYAVSVW